MFSRTLALSSLALVPALALALGCSKTEPPTVAPKSVAVTGVTSTGLDLAAKIAVTNPNDFALTAQAVQAHVVLGGTVDLGVVHVDKAFTLPKSATTDLDVPLAVTWENVAPLLPLMQKPSINFTVDGTVEFGSALTIKLPFHLEGTLRREELMKASSIKLPTLPM